jgi:hypothetical protein
LQCFILKKGKKFGNFEARSVDGIFFGHASHSRAYRVLNLETNQIMETCEVTFDESQPCSQLVFECAGDDELGEEIYGPSPTPTTTNPIQEETTVEGEVASR